MYCRWCERGGKPEVLDEDGELSSLSGKPGAWVHIQEDNWRPCWRKAAELRALEVLCIDFLRACRELLKAAECPIEPLRDEPKRESQ